MDDDTAILTIRVKVSAPLRRDSKGCVFDEQVRKM